MPTTLVELTDQLREAFGLTPDEARSLIVRLVPTLEIGAVSDESSASAGPNWALGRGRIGPVAGQFSMSQLFNPANSGTILHLKQVLGTTTATTDLNIMRYDTALGTLQTNKQWADQRRSGGPVGEMRSTTNVAQLGSTIYHGRTKSDSWQWFDFPAPIILAPGQGVMIQNALFNTLLGSSFFWREERE